MGRTFISIFILAGLLLAACQPAAQSASLPLTGASASRLGAAALMLQEQPGTQTFSIVPIEAGTGKPAPKASPVVIGNVISFGFSSDRRELAFLSNDTTDCLIACLHQIDLVRWKEAEPVPLEGDFGEWYIIPTFESKSASLPIILNKQTETASVVELVNRARAGDAQKGVKQKKSLPANILKAAYTPQGNLALYGIQTNPAEKKSLVYLALLDGSDLRVLWEQTLTDLPFLAEWAEDSHSDPTQGRYLDPAAVFSSDGSTLYLVAAGQPLLVTVDFQKQKVTTYPIQPRAGLLDRLMALGATVAHAKTMNGISKSGVLSPDGRLLYVVGYQTTAVKNEQGDYEMEFTSLGMQVIDARDGTLIRTVKTEAAAQDHASTQSTSGPAAQDHASTQSASGPAAQDHASTQSTSGPREALLDLDGKHLLLHGWREVKGGNAHPWTEIMDPDSGQVLQRLEGTAYPSRLLDGSLAWLVVEQNFDTASTLDIYRPGEAKPRSQIFSPGYVDWIPIP